MHFFFFLFCHELTAAIGVSPSGAGLHHASSSVFHRKASASPLTPAQCHPLTHRGLYYTPRALLVLSWTHLTLCSARVPTILRILSKDLCPI